MTAALAFLRHNRWLLLRRAAQLGILAAFLSGPLAGVWILHGTLASSTIFGSVSLTDPLILIQSLAAGHWPASTALVGGIVVLAFYALLAGRAYCAWVCPVNLVADLAAWSRRRLSLPATITLDRRLRVAILVGAVAASAATGTIAWEFVNPVTMVQRGIVTGTLLGGGGAVIALLCVFLFDFGVVAHGWCGSLCPVGAFYALVGAKRSLGVAATNRVACTQCGSCVAVCPEPQIIAPALHGPDAAIRTGLCTSCGRCIDVCAPGVFQFAVLNQTATDTGSNRPSSVDAAEGEGSP